MHKRKKNAFFETWNLEPPLTYILFLFQVVRQPSTMNKVSVAITNGPPIRQFGERIGNDRIQSEDYSSPENSCHFFSKLTEQTAKSVDRVCRFLFPCAFVIFNLVYWFSWAPWTGARMIHVICICNGLFIYLCL